VHSQRSHAHLGNRQPAVLMEMPVGTTVWLQPPGHRNSVLRSSHSLPMQNKSSGL